MTQIITLVGDLGAGKTTLAAVLAMIVKYANPSAPCFSNITAGGCLKVDDIHKLVATKLNIKNRDYAFCLDDEAAQTGLESRGSGSKSAAVEARVITHARKANVDLVLISQLKSMLDKRAQWVEDISILCEAVYETGNYSSVPDYFHYTVYDKTLAVVEEFDLEPAEMMQSVWPQMDTYDIPMFESFKKQFESFYKIEPAYDYPRFDGLMEEAARVR